jgi:glycosyltransferase involved in cell wall biosynthesis
MKLLICTQAVDKNHPILGFFHGWVTEFARHFQEVHVICLIKGVHTLPANVHVYSLGKEDGESNIKYIVRFYKYFSTIFFHTKVDVVFYHMGAIYNILGAPFFFLRTFFKTKFYWWKAHGYISKTARLGLCFVDTVVTSTASGFSVATKKRKIVGQAIDTTLFALLHAKHRNKEVIFVGRIMKVKHIEDFIDTAAILLKDDTTIQFTVIGPVGDEAYFASLENKLTEHNIQDRVRFVGSKKQEELVSVYQTAAVFLNTSQTHSMDKTVLEAGLCGCIPVTANHAFKELLQSDGLFVAHATPEAYAQVIKKLLYTEETEMYRKSLREKIVAGHSLDTFTHRIFNI